MKLTCSQAALNSNLQFVGRAVAARPTHPVLANVLLTADVGTGKVSLTGFDLSLGIQSSFAATVEQSGAITLPARLFGDIVSRLSADSPLSLQSPGGESPKDEEEDSEDEEKDSPLSFQLTARTGTYTVMGLSAEDFPDLPMAKSPVGIPLSAQALRDGLGRTLFATSSDEAKQVLTGVHLTVSSHGLEFAATDGHRLAVLKQSQDNSAVGNDDQLTPHHSDTPSSDVVSIAPYVEAAVTPEPVTQNPSQEGSGCNHKNPDPVPVVEVQDGTPAPWADNNLEEGVDDEGFAVTVPARSLRELERLLVNHQSDEAVDLYYDQGQIVFLWADQVVTSLTLNGDYPKYHQLIPDTFSRWITVNRVLLITALERVAVLADKQNNVVKLSIAVASRQLRIAADVQDVGCGNESLPLLDAGGDDLDVAFNVQYLLDGLKVLPTAEVKFQINQSTNPVVLRPAEGDSDFTYLVMPVQIRS